MGSVLTIIEHFGGNVKKSSLSAITFAKQLAEKAGTHFDIALIGSGVAGLAGSVKKYGAKTVYLLDAPLFEKYLAQSFSFAVGELVAKAGADYVCAVSSTLTRDFLPRVAARLNAGMVSETLGVTDGGFLRPMWAGNVVAEVKVNTQKAVFTVR
ncbi:MAG: electron transfer flavoprotein subunit alpha/FixB family protein, partial [Deltaproteobacteria bacterium]|nr:electron transfer flavoprotein subunit alpha/FixB family protein [Deltaproteobacteria bacterium]